MKIVAFNEVQGESSNNVQTLYGRLTCSYETCHSTHEIGCRTPEPNATGGTLHVDIFLIG